MIINITSYSEKNSNIVVRSESFLLRQYKFKKIKKKK